jgi:hypothetical protein
MPITRLSSAKASCTSSNGMSAARSSTHGRIDHDE